MLRITLLFVYKPNLVSLLASQFQNVLNPSVSQKFAYIE